MKKYIRTEDGIYQFKNNENICKKDNELFEIQRFFQPVDHINYKLLGKIKAEADFIEELCDEFVIKHIAILKPYVADRYQKTKILKDRQKVFLYGVEEIKGAIYTDKGLIYVAKMNKNGGLELI